MNVKRLALMSFMMLSLNACATVAIVNDLESKPIGKTKTIPVIQNAFTVVLPNPVVIQEHCEDKKWKSLKMHEPFYSGFLSLATMGFLSAYEAEVTCAGTSQPNVKRPG